MKSAGQIRQRIRELRAVCDDPNKHDTDQRVAQAVESALLWVLRDDQRFNITADALLISKFLREDLQRRAGRSAGGGQ